MVSIVLCVSRMCLVMFRNASNYVVGNSALCLPCVSGHVVCGVCDMILVIFCNESCMVLVVCSMFTMGVLEMLRSVSYMCLIIVCRVYHVFLGILCVCYMGLVVCCCLFLNGINRCFNVSHVFGHAA